MISNVMNIAKTSIALLLATICAALCQTPLPTLPPDGFVTLEQIVNDFANSADSAFQKYNGMRICVYGRVGKVTQSDDTEGDPLTVYLQLPNRPTPDVKAYFDSDDILSATVGVSSDDSRATLYHRDWSGNILRTSSLVVTGENTAIRGTFDNFVAGDIILKNSFKLDPAALQKKLTEHGIATE